MKILLNISMVLFCLTLYAEDYAEEINLNIQNTSNSYTNYIDAKSDLYEKVLSERVQKTIDTNEILMLAKYYILGGNIEKAKALLFKIGKVSEGQTITKARYEALIYFVEGNYQKSLSILNNPIYEYTPLNYHKYQRVCDLKLMNQFILNLKDDFLKELPYCKAVTKNYSDNDHLWYRFWETKIKNDRMMGASNSKQSLNLDFYRDEVLSVKYLTRDLNSAKIWLKAVIYAHKEREVLPFLSFLPAEFYHSEKIRELLAFIHYNLGNYNLAESFIEDIHSANAENIKGNLRMSEGKFELALGHFVLALQKRANSKNSFYRAVALAWALNKSDLGIKLIMERFDPNYDEKFKLIMLLAFKIRDNNFFQADRIINLLTSVYKMFSPHKVILSASYIASIFKIPEEIDRLSRMSCHKFDSLNCWITLQTLTWPDFYNLLSFEKKEYKPIEFSIEKLKESNNVETVSIEEKYSFKGYRTEYSQLHKNNDNINTSNDDSNNSNINESTND